MSKGPTMYELTPIGIARSPVVERVDRDWGSVEAAVVLSKHYRRGLPGLEEFSHAMVVTLLHEACFDPERHLRRRPRGLATMPEVGIFAQRAKDHPNRIGVTAVRILAVGENSITVTVLDAIDDTPVLDLKPYYPAYDRIEDAKVPAWVETLMKDYF